MNPLRMLFWETTSACNLKCIHCRACATGKRPSDELTLEQGKDLLRHVASFSEAVVVLSGGEPLVREDILDIARSGNDLGLRMALATNATLVTKQIADDIKISGIQRISVSIDAPNAEAHDRFRQVDGAFDMAMRGIEHIKSAGIPFQINTTVTNGNLNLIKDMLPFSVSLGACGLHLFLLVPTGCGKEIGDSEMISNDEYEEVLGWLAESQNSSNIELRATCAPHYFRILAQNGSRQRSKGCLAGTGICFVSSKGEVYPCGYFPLSAGNVLKQPLQDIWENSELFIKLRQSELLEGKCGVCEFKTICGGCRARAYAEKGNYMAEEPYCAYIPSRMKQ